MSCPHGLRSQKMPPLLFIQLFFRNTAKLTFSPLGNSTICPPYLAEMKAYKPFLPYLAGGMSRVNKRTMQLNSDFCGSVFFHQFKVVYGSHSPTILYQMLFC